MPSHSVRLLKRLTGYLPRHSVANAEYSHSTPSLSANPRRIRPADLFLPHVRAVTCIPPIDVQRILPRKGGNHLSLIYFVDIRFRLQRGCQNLKLCSPGGSALVCSHTDFPGTSAGIHIGHHRASALMLSLPPRPNVEANTALARQSSVCGKQLMYKYLTQR